MKLIIHTKYGKFEGIECPFDQKKYNEISTFLNEIHRLTYACFNTVNGDIYMTKEMLNDCIVEVIK